MQITIVCLGTDAKISDLNKSNKCPLAYKPSDKIKTQRHRKSTFTFSYLIYIYDALICAGGDFSLIH